MKQFEKWWKKHNSQRGILADDFRRDGYVWQAALEWVKREAISSDERGDSSRTVINRELDS